MINFALIGTVFVVHLLGLMSPGPDFIMLIRNSLVYSRRTGIYTAIGFGAGITVHIAYSLAGLALIISKSIVAFSIIKMLGGAYLIYIGIKSIRARSKKIEIGEEEQKKDISPFAAIRVGFLTNALNPKAALYFLGLFSLVISPDTPAFMMLILTIIMIIETIAWFSLLAIFLTQKRIRGTFSRFQTLIDKSFGGLLVALGIKVALSQK